MKEVLSVAEPTATIQMTRHLVNGTERIRTRTIDVMSGSHTSGAFQGFVISANSKVGDSIHISGVGNITMVGETTRTNAGVSRAVVCAYTSYSQSGIPSGAQSGVQLTSCWDKQTGIFVEETGISAIYTMTFKVS